ncbi:Pimeloyl-ACP methyl ester carboxylesterase [Amycolatopsis xylanica]|uniref:Pimeloyl-ACP methyl ester carboxylesterase n=1 Tax=Amycolatopsis xylanica TaxID=589385 RepID=A0A1H3LSU0_9PSEU|nr:alpha/beta fold hydrolase [Amycolatopsis xylanica]SDY67390.1 Pimeloyl-ACP methyl ester carboxylesterase [Amycolatopsis xylanica]
MNIYKSEAGRLLLEGKYREALKSWPVEHETLTVPTREGDTFVVASGPAGAPPVVALHGSMANTVRWLGSVSEWTRDHRVYAVDIIGEPGLSAPSRPPMDSDAYALWLSDVVRELGIERAAVVGESLGGWMALDFATRRPEQVTSLVLLTPGGVGRQKMAVLFKALFWRMFGEWGQRRALSTAIGTELDPVAASYVLAISKNFNPRKKPLPVFPDEALRGLKMPMLVVVGARDEMLDTTQTALRLGAAVPHARIEVLPSAGHLLPDQTKVISEFLAAVDA